mgnify:CR=1 FL=1
MIYMTHNLMANYHSANGAGDEKMKADILTSELAKLIAKHPNRVMEDLQAEGFAVTLPITPDNLVGRVADALYQSSGFAKRIVNDILSGNYSFCCAEGDDKKKKDDNKKLNPIDYGELMGNASNLINGLGNLFGGKKKAKADTEKARAEAEKAKYEARKSLAEKTKALLESKKSQIGWYISGAIAIAILITTVILIVRKIR